MQIKCEYCDGYFEDTLENCPHCNGTNNNIRRTVDKTPRTIEELAKWYADRKLPPYETTRFFIGINYTGARAFGIYEENGQFIVYKNKDDGSRAIRYQGTDEAYAVNELFLKLKSEILNQKSNAAGVGSKGKPQKKVAKGVLYFVGFWFATVFIAGLSNAFDGFLLAAGIAILTAIVTFLIMFFTPLKNVVKKKFIPIIVTAVIAFAISIVPAHRYYSPRYYNYNNNVYCRYENSYYLYDSYINDYSYVYDDELPYELTSNPDDYEYNWDDAGWDDSYSFKDSGYYEANYSSDSSDSDSGYDWSSNDSWDSGSTDWGSDW